MNLNNGQNLQFHPINDDRLACYINIVYHIDMNVVLSIEITRFIPTKTEKLWIWYKMQWFFNAIKDGGYISDLAGLRYWPQWIHWSRRTEGMKYWLITDSLLHVGLCWWHLWSDFELTVVLLKKTVNVSRYHYSYLSQIMGSHSHVWDHI